MSDSFLETDEILQALVLELEKFKTSSEQLALAEENTGDLLSACNELVELCKHLIERNKQQLDETVQLARDTEERHNLVIDAHQESTASTKEKLNALATTLTTNERIINGVANTLETHGKQLDIAAASTEEKLNALTTTLATNEHVINGIVDTLDKRGKQLDTLENRFQHEVKPILQRIQSTAGLTRVLTYILLLMGVVNGAAVIYIIRLLSN